MRQSSKANTSLEQTTSVDVLLGRAAMLGFVLAFGAYLTVDIVAPGFV